MTDFKVGDVVVTPCNTLVRIDEFVRHGLFISINAAGYGKTQSAAFLSKCKLATAEDRACFKAQRLENLRNEISSLSEDIYNLKSEIEEEEKMA